MNFLIAIDGNNLDKLKEALTLFGGPSIDLEAFKEKGYVIRIGRSPIQIDIINKADGIDISVCYPRKETIIADDVEISVIPSMA